MQDWEKVGLVLSSIGGALARSHAMLPTPIVSSGGIRVLVASCDADMRGRIFSVELDPGAPTQVIVTHPQPLFDLGEPGAFDADGVNPSQVIDNDGALFMYYIGWKRGPASAPYTLFAGLAISEDGGKSFRRWSKEPILLPRPGEEYFRTAPHVYRSNNRWEMLYIGGGTFFAGASGKILPNYSLRRTVSRDGIVWEEPSDELLAPDGSQEEIGFGRPLLWHDASGRPVLMLSVRRESGYLLVELAPSTESICQRNVLPRSESGWDSEMVCFGAPCVLGDRELLFYNGNQFGRSGFGLAQRPSIAQRTGSVRHLLDCVAAYGHLRTECKDT